MNAQIRYVAVGDSYTIGEGAGRNESWPAVLVKLLQGEGIKIELVSNPAKTGWLTQHVIDLELPIFEKYQPTLASLLIGVNDWVQEVPKETFRHNFKIILDRMQLALSDKKNLILVTIPDFSVTPNGHIFSAGADVPAGISEYNEVIKEDGKNRNLPVVDVFPLSQEMKVDPSLVALDGLHPSAKEYELWAKEIFPVALKLLGN